jgi:hypothetical protein
MRSRFASRFVFQLASRAGLDAVAVGLRRLELEPREGDARIAAMVALLLLCGALYTLTMLCWLATGRGPGGRWFAFGAGAPSPTTGRRQG